MSGDLITHFDNLRAIFDEVLEEKNTKWDRKSNDVVEKRKSASLLFVLIKKTNRMEKYQARNGREKLHSEKVHVDSKRLQLQNLLYEVNHLKREIRHCHQFKSQDEDIELMGEKDYCAMGIVQQLHESTNSNHAKRLARLEWELSLRKQLSTNCKELLNAKKQVLHDIVLKAERLTSFAPSLCTLLKATRPLQDALQVPIDREWKLGQLVQLLPQPLYLAYINLNALEVAGGELELRVAVIGTEESVHQIECAATRAEFISSRPSSSEEVSSKRRKIYNESSSHLLEEQQKQFLEPHPLEVRFSIGNAKDLEDCIVVHVRFFPLLGFATASAVMNIKESDGILGEIISSQDILNCIYENDLGDKIPISGTEQKIELINMTSEQCLEYINNKNFGKPYNWLQKLCYIEIFNRNANECSETKLQKLAVEVLSRIQSNWISRLNLIKQIRTLVNKNTNLYLKDEELPLVKPSCSLVQWTSVSWEEYLSNNSTFQYININLVNARNFFYRAVIVRGSAKMECLVSTSRKFPNESPVWAICVYWNGHHNAINNAAIKMMEYWTNSLNQCQLQSKLALLSSQLIRTMYSFDIFLETEGPLYSPVEYNKEKHYIKAFSKRIRARPYRFLKRGTINTFKQ